VEVRLRFNPFDFLQTQLHCQLLETGDINVIDTLNDPNQTKYWKRDGYNDRPVRPDEYGGLFGRSRYSGAVNIAVDVPELGFMISFRGVFKSRYGDADLNGNKILDDETEYTLGYSLWYLTLSKNIFNYFRLQVGVDNLFNYKSQKARLVTSGRTIYARLIFNYIIE
jgi:outer membrane receptor for ferrienterochelin and colicins